MKIPYLFADPVKLPSCWSDMGVDKRYIRVTLDKQSEEYKKVQTTFIKTTGKSEKDIYRVRAIDNIITL